MESAGARLKRLRLEKGLTLDEVKRKTKIHLNILKALEEDGIINLSPIYIKGFLKIYCKFLGVDPRDFITDYPKHAPLPKETPVFPKKSRLSLKIPFLNLGTFKFINIKIKKIFIIFSILLLSIILFCVSFKFIFSKQGFLHSRKVKKTIQTAKLKKAKEQLATVKIPQTEAQIGSQRESPSMIRLGIRAREDCWIRLKVDGHMVFQNILRKGRQESWQAKDKMEFTLGNAGVVDLEVNGKLISSLGRKGQAIKNILITKEQGLVIPR